MKKSVISLLAVILASLFVAPAYSQGYPVFDISGWLNGIDQLYTGYDIVTASIENAQRQYEAIQKAVDRAKSIDWDNIEFTADIDIRDDIRNVNSRINNTLNQLRSIKETLNTPIIDCGDGNRYSVADLCGQGREGANLLTACQNFRDTVAKSRDNAIEGLVSGLSDEEKKAIWAKYGISPYNYVFTQQTISYVREKAQTCLAYATEAAKKLRLERSSQTVGAIESAACQTLDQDGNLSEGATREATMKLTGQVVEDIQDLAFRVDDGFGLVAAKMIADDAERQAEADARMRQQVENEIRSSKLPSGFRK